MTSAAAPQARTDERCNMFVTGTLYAAGGSAPVRIRNLSRTGALIEGAALPPAGTTVRLSRGTLSVGGEMMWVAAGKGGLRLSSPVSATDWMPMGERGRGQQLIDEVMHRARLGAVPPNPAAAVRAPALNLGTELVRLQQMLQRAGEDLVSEQSLSPAHVAALQAMDVVAASLGELAAAVDDPAKD